MKLAIEQKAKIKALLHGKRVGLITNPTGGNGQGISAIELLQEEANLVCLFAPEHGVRGNFQAGVHFEDYIDQASGIYTYSLYGASRTPSKEALATIDALCIDLQDVGSRFYTYTYTMAYAMMACKEANKTFVVFDRPNPIGGQKVEGNILDTAYRSFIGYFPIVQRHGMTLGELALLFNHAFGIGCDLKVVEMEGWNRKKYYDEYNLLWIPPSPNIPTIEAALAYNGTCIFEGTNISEGRGTTKPFEIVGAPFLDAPSLAASLNQIGLPGVVFTPTYFTPTFSKHQGTLCQGVMLHITDRGTFLPVKTGWTMLETIRTASDAFRVNPPYHEGGKVMLDLNTGTDAVSKHQWSLSEQWNKLEEDSLAFSKMREQYLLY